MEEQRRLWGNGTMRVSGSGKSGLPRCVVSKVRSWLKTGCSFTAGVGVSHTLWRTTDCLLLTHPKTGKPAASLMAQDPELHCSGTSVQ